MQFIYPGFLAALGFLAIPIIVHLFNFVRYKKIYFSNVHFLKEVKEQTQSRSRLKHLLILLSRLLAVLFLVFAFAQPYIPASNSLVKEGAKAVSIYIDNSFSMAALGKNGTLLDEAKKDASDIISGYSATDQFQLLTNDFLGNHQHLVSKKTVTELLDEVQISPSVKKLDEIYARQHDLLSQAPQENKIAYIISDFQQASFDFSTVKSDSTITCNIVPLIGNKTANLYIDSCWFESPARQYNAQERMLVRVKNTGSADAENVPLKLLINGVQRAVATITIKAEGTSQTELSFTNKESGLINGVVEINDYPLSYDNNYYFSYTVNKQFNIFILNKSDENVYLNKLFKNDSLFNVQQSSPKTIDYGALGKNNLLVICNLDELSSGLVEEIKTNIEKGLNVLLFPGLNANLAEYNSLLSNFNTQMFPLDTNANKVNYINFKHPIYTGVFDESKMKKETVNYPLVKKYFPIKQYSSGSQELLIGMVNGSPFLQQYTLGKGKLFLSASPLDENSSSFARHAIFVPTLYKIAISSSTQNPLFYTIGQSQNIEVNSVIRANEPVYHLQSADGKTDFIAQSKATGFTTVIDANKQLKLAGNYWLKSNANDTLKSLSFNYNRIESNAEFLSVEDIEKAISSNGLKHFTIVDKGVKNMAATLLSINKGTQLWKWCVIMALLCLAIEIALIRWMKS